MIRGWRAGDRVILPALRRVYSYDERWPDRATGFLYDEGGDHPPGRRVTGWPEPLALAGPELLAGVRAATRVRFTAVVFQAYRDGAGCDWHPDADWGAQAILSLGVTRTFGLRKPGAELYVQLAHGDLMFLPDGCQREWEHCVPAENVTGERCSLVFRATTEYCLPRP